MSKSDSEMFVVSLIGQKGGSGKCLGRGTPVLMFDGTIKPVEAIEDGDLLMGPDSKPRLVSGIHAGFGPLYRVKPNKGASFVVNEKHVLSLKMSLRRLSAPFHQVRNVPVSEYLTWGPCHQRDSMLYRVGVEWPDQDVRIDPYLMGCWLGDGTSIEPAITTADSCVLEAMNTFCVQNGMTVVVKETQSKATTYNMKRVRVIRSQPTTVPARLAGRFKHKNPFTEALKAMGVIGNKHIPWEYKVNSREARLALLAGLIDTDGYKHSGYFEVIQKREALAQDIAFVARSLGFASYIHPCVKSCTYKGKKRSGIYYRVNICGHIDEIPVRIDRKKPEPRRQIKDVTVTGFSLERIEDGEFFGFEVDQDHLFLLGDFTVTHNTTLSLNLAVAAARSGLSACILDLDPQANAANWADRRPADANLAVVSAPPSRLRQTLDAARTGGARFVVIDTPGKADSAAIAAAAAASIALIPVGPQMFHLETLPGVLQLIRVASPVPPAWVVLNGIHPLAKAQAATLKRMIASTYGVPVCPVHLSHLEIYGSSADGGQTPLETDPKGRAAGEIRALWKFTLTQLLKTVEKVEKNDDKGK